MSSDNSKMNQKILGQHGIVLSKDVYSPRNSDTRLPEYVEIVIEALLDHNIQVDESAHGAKLARIAKEYHAAKVSQDAWAQFLESYIFLSFEEESLGKTPGRSKLFDAWSLETNISWNAVTKLNQISEDPPQPSFTYGFPVHVPLDESEKTPLTGFNRNELVTNFSLSSLVDLGPMSICPTILPSTLKTRMAEGYKPDQKDLICFPWALVEVQSASTNELAEEACYCRAALAANAALDMQRQLQPFWAVSRDIPPVIIFTCFGPEVRVWVSFLEIKRPTPSQRCICIWAGTLTAERSIVTLREIVQNMTFWASRVLKPQISSRISLSRPIVYASPAVPHGTIMFRNTASHQPRPSEHVKESDSERPCQGTKEDSSLKQKMFVFGSSSNASGKTWKFHTEKNDALKTEKPISSNRSTLPEQNLTLLAAAVKAHTEGIKKSETEKPVTNIRSGLWSPEQNFPIIQSSNVPVTKIKKIYFRGKAIIIRLPSHDERQPRRVTEADYEDKFYSWMAAHQTIISTPTALVDKQETAGNYDDPAKISEDLKSLQIGTSENAKGSKEADGKLGLKNSTPGSGEGELKTKKSPIVDAEEQGTQPSKDQSLGISYTGADGSDEVDDDSIGKYFIYRTNESFHARSYDAAIWDSDGENDQSYASPISGSEADFEGSDIDIEEDDADDEGSESGSSNDYDDASIEALLSELKPENERVNSPSGSFQGPPGQVSDLTLDDIDNFLYTAANVISGEAFIRLKPIHNLIENLNGVDLLDATWRCIENWDGQSPNLYSDQMKRLLATVENLNDFVVTECADIDPFKHHHLTMGLRKKELDETLQRMQKKGDWRLRILLQSLLRSWDGEKCMELLSNELLESAPDEFDNMLQEAFDVVYSDSNLVDTVQ